MRIRRCCELLIWVLLISVSLVGGCSGPRQVEPVDAGPAPGDGPSEGDATGDATGDGPALAVGDTIALTTTGRLVSFDRATPGTLLATATPHGLAAGERVVGIDVRPRDRALYALTTEGKVYVIDPATGATTHGVKIAARAGADVEIDFDPVLDRLHVVSADGSRLIADVESGLTDTVSGGALAGMAFASDFAAACRSAQYAIDPKGDLLAISGPGFATMARVGALGIRPGHAALDIATDAAGADAAFVGDGAGFYTVDLATGAATLRDALPLAAGEAIAGLALEVADVAPAQPPGELFAITQSHRLITLRQAVPAKPCTSAPITGLGADERVIGFDAEPSTGALFVVAASAASAHVYRLDPATAVAADPLGQPLAPLRGTRFGASFDPTAPDILRIVSDAGQNLRFNVAIGVTTVDPDLHGATEGAVAAAYTDAVAGAGTAALYVIDDGRLRIATQPSAGVVIDVGPLGIPVTGVAAIEIDGKDNAALLATGTDTATTLYQVSLADGSTTSLGVIGGDEPLRGLTRRARATTVFGLATDGTLVKVALDRTTPTTVVGSITGLAGDTLVGIDVRPSTGILYGVGASGAIYEIDRETAAATPVSSLSGAALDAGEVGIDFDPTGTNELRLVAATRQNLRVPDVATGAAIAETAAATIARSYAITALAYSENHPTLAAPTAYGFDATTNKLVTIVPPETGRVREIGPAGATPAAVRKSAFEIAGASTGLAVEGDFSNALLEVDLRTGATTRVGTIAFADPGPLPIISVIGLAAPPSRGPPAADAPIFAVDTAQRLIRFPRNAPGAAVTLGLLDIAPEDLIVGIDIEPSTGELWILATSALTQHARLYTVIPPAQPISIIDAALQSTLVDASGPISLPLRPAGVDFRPNIRRFLRIVTDDGRNLFVNPQSGFTLTQSPIGLPSLEIGAAAYTNNFAGATTTRLYVIDRASASLLVVPDPSSGIAVPVGALSPSLEYGSSAAFDIAGGNNGLALAALQIPSQSSGSILFQIDLTTGAAKQLDDGIDGAPIRGIAIDIR